MKLLVFAFVYRTPQRHGREFFAVALMVTCGGGKFSLCQEKKINVSLHGPYPVRPTGVLTLRRELSAMLSEASF